MTPIARFELSTAIAISAVPRSITATFENKSSDRSVRVPAYACNDWIAFIGAFL
jgi:hypothetical protein